eukprot:615344-Pleurochrysis_carterae.AAC.1
MLKPSPLAVSKLIYVQALPLSVLLWNVLPQLIVSTSLQAAPGMPVDSVERAHKGCVPQNITGVHGKNVSQWYPEMNMWTPGSARSDWKVAVNFVHYFHNIVGMNVGKLLPHVMYKLLSGLWVLAMNCKYKLLQNRTQPNEESI